MKHMFYSTGEKILCEADGGITESGLKSLILFYEKFNYVKVFLINCTISKGFENNINDTNVSYNFFIN
jgi:hypothetical protein